MSDLERLIEVIEQAYREVVEAAGDLTKIGQVLKDIEAPIRAASTPDAMAEVLKNSVGQLPDLHREGITQDQGYIARLIFDDGKLEDFKIWSAFEDGKLKPAEMDPIEQEFSNYVTMAAVKAMRAVAYLNRPMSAVGLEEEEFLHMTGQSFGSSGIAPGTKVVAFGSTGFMPEEVTMHSMRNIPGGAEHLDMESCDPFKGSGACDQVFAELSVDAYLRSIGLHSSVGPVAPTILEFAARTVDLTGRWN